MLGHAYHALVVQITMSSLRKNLRSLQSLDPDVRKRAILALAEEQSLEALQALEKTAKADTSLELRFLAKKALATLQQAMSSNAAPKPADGGDPFFSGSEDEKIKAIKNAAAQKSPKTLDRLLKLLDEEESGRVRGTALLAVGLLGGAGQISVFSKYIRDPDPNVRLNCVKALTYMDEAITYPLFVVSLNDSTPQVASRSYGFLRKLGKENIIALLKTMAQARHRWMRKAVAKACGRLNTPEVIPILRELASREKGDIRTYAVKSLKTLTDLGNQQAQAVLGTMKDVADKIVAQASQAENLSVSTPNAPKAKSEGHIIATRSAGFIIPAGQKDLPLNADSPSDRMNALQEIVDEGDPARIPEVLTRLRIEKNLKVKAALLAALGQLGGDEEVDHIKLYLEHPDARIRATAVENIGKLSPDNMVQLLNPFLVDEDNRTAANAIVALGDCPEVQLLPPLERLAQSKKVNHRKSAIYAILQLEDSETATLLVTLGKDSNSEVAERAKEVLELLKAKGVVPSTATSQAEATEKKSKVQKEKEQRRKERAAARQSSLNKSQLPSRVDLDKAVYMQGELAPDSLLTACYFDYAVASSLAIALFGTIYLAAVDGPRFGIMLAIALGVPLAYVYTALCLQSGQEWARQFTLVTATILPVPGLGVKTKVTLASEEAFDYFDTDPSNPGVIGRAAAGVTVGLLVIFLILLLI